MVFCRYNLFDSSRLNETNGLTSRRRYVCSKPTAKILKTTQISSNNPYFEEPKVEPFCICNRVLARPNWTHTINIQLDELLQYTYATSNLSASTLLSLY